jgi:ribosomal protein S18 acetylase RimI-like enzyme
MGVTTDNVELVAVAQPEQIQVAQELFREYAQAIGVDLEYQGFAAELSGLPAPYAPPDGLLLLAQINGQTGGCVAMRRLGPHIAEMKRLYVRSQHRGLRIGERLVDAVIDSARRSNYQALRLDTLPSMASAQGLYRKLGFVEIAAYNNTHLPETRFYELKL